MAHVDKACLVLQSGIHGWGLFARKHVKQDSMVIEYRGDLLRRTAADAREKAYQAAGKDCYLFTVNDDCVIDATMKGGIGRFTVCSSNCPRLVPNSRSQGMTCRGGVLREARLVAGRHPDLFMVDSSHIIGATARADIGGFLACITLF